MSDVLKETFNELAAIKGLYDAWGRAAIPHIPQEGYEAVIAALNADDNKNFKYTFVEHGQYLQMEKTGADVFGFDKAADLALKAVKQADFNLGIILPFMTAVDPKTFLPAVDNTDQLKNSLEKYGLTAMKGLV